MKPIHKNNRIKLIEYRKAYEQRPEVKARKKVRRRKPEVQARIKAHTQQPEIKARKKAYDKARYQQPELKAKRKLYRKAYEKIPEVKERRKAYTKRYLQKQEVKERRKAYYKIPEAIAKAKAYRDIPEVKAKAKAYYKAYNKTTGAKIRMNRYICDRYHSDVVFNLRMRMTTRIRRFFKINNVTKNNRTMKIIGCSQQELKKHIEKQFTAFMTWPLFLSGHIHIDHRIPLASAKTEEDVYKLCHHSNLQPLWATENLRKSAKII